MPEVTVIGSNDLSAAFAQLRVKLLDLSGRNRLINYKHSVGKAIQFIDGSTSDIYKKLVDDNSTVNILALPEPTRNDYIEKNGRLQRPDPKEWCIKKKISWSYEIPRKSESTSLKALMYSEDLVRHCRKIEREATLAIEETGANMLFLAIGFLEYPEQTDSDKKLLAPLICIPVSLVKRDSNSGQAFLIQYTGDDVSENISLKEKLKNDFNLSLPDFNDDEFVIDGYFDDINQLIVNKPKFEFKNQISLCMLSFTNMLLLRDIDPAKWSSSGSKNSLSDHPIVKLVLQGESDVNEIQSDDSVGLYEYNVEKPENASIPLIYDADSSQHSAIIDVIKHNKNLVIQGPPGTGKSQTITNLIAACIASGKKVLFVAEKLVALEVVKNRLSHAGLGNFVLELHSNKSSKKKVLDEISDRLTFTRAVPRTLPSLLENLEEKRRNLQDYVDKINTRVNNSLGLTVQQVIWRAEKYRKSGDVDLVLVNNYIVPDAESITETELSKKIDALKHLGSNYDRIKSFSDGSPFWGFYPESVVPGMEIQLLNLLQGSADWASQLVSDSKKLSEILEDDVRGFSFQSGNTQAIILDGLLANTDSELPLDLIPVYFEEDPKGAVGHAFIKKFKEAITRYKSEEANIQNVLLDEISVNNHVVGEYANLIARINDIAIDVDSISGLEKTVTHLDAEIQVLKDNVDAISSFCSKYGIRYWQSVSQLNTLESCLVAITKAPLDSLHLLSDKLISDDAVNILRELIAIRKEVEDTESDISQVIYLDMLPSPSEIKSAALTMRQGDAWYRIFQKDWRQAISLHKKILISKVKMSSDERLKHLHQLIKWNELKEKYDNHSAWSGLVDKTKIKSIDDLKKYLELASWSSLVSGLLDEVQSKIVDLSNFTKTEALANNQLLSETIQSLGKTIKSIQKISESAKAYSDHNESYYPENIIESIDGYISSYEILRKWIDQCVNKNTDCERLQKACSSAMYRRVLEKYVEDDEHFKLYTSSLYEGINTDIETVFKVFELGKAIDKLRLPDQIKTKLRSGQFLVKCAELSRLFKSICSGLRGVDEFYEKLGEFGPLYVDEWCKNTLEDNLYEYVSEFNQKLNSAAESILSIFDWAAYNAQRNKSFELNLDEYIGLLESGDVDSSKLGDTYAYCVYASIVKSVFKKNKTIGMFNGLVHSQIREEYQNLDKQVISLRGAEVASNVISFTRTIDGSSGIRVDDKTEMSLINYLLPQTRPRMPVRKILARAPKSIQALKPCFMMGPQAVAQYLTPGALHFDIVIMDEASQLKPEEAIGSIARGSQLVVVGDPKQLPPSSFFSRSAQVGEDEDQFTTSDAESILDLCSFHFQPIRSLRWHYRSQHHSLIAFSNSNFYKNKLVVFPSPYGEGGGLGVRAIYLADAVYDHQINMKEAMRIVEEVLRHMLERPNDSFGIVTLNIKQRDIIQEMLEEKVRTIPEAMEYKAKWSGDGQQFFVKNLENVQGDERDVIYISTTFGKPPGSGSVRQNFGPISRQGGWRRLNVLFTRARKSIVLVTSLRPEDIVVDNTTPEGTKALRNYLDFARSGQIVRSEETDLDPDSDFEVSVIDMLRERGYEVTPQLGVAGYRIDIAVKHPKFPSSYLAAIECDGATYHSALSVRDRDRIRQEILESLGWKGRIWRIWSTDWFRTPLQESDKLIAFLDELRETWRPEHASGQSWVEESHSVQVIPDATQNDTDMPGEIETTIAEGIPVGESLTKYLLDTDEIIEVECNDTVRYESIEESIILTIQISLGPNDLNSGIANLNTPLAQALLGAVKGDEVLLQIPGVKSKTLKILEIIKSK